MDKRVMSELEYIVQAYGYTRIDWERIRRCTREEKETLIPWVKELIAWEKKYRLEGLLILEEWIQDLESPLEKLMVDRCCDCGNPPERRSEIFYNFLCSSDLDDVSYLEICAAPPVPPGTLAAGLCDRHHHGQAPDLLSGPGFPAAVSDSGAPRPGRSRLGLNRRGGLRKRGTIQKIPAIIV